MLFAHLNDINGRESEQSDLPEIDALKDKACIFGPAIGSHVIGQTLPQSAGAFVTSGAYAACQGLNQQSEQHRPTTTSSGSGLGEIGIGPIMLGTPTPEVLMPELMEAPVPESSWALTPAPPIEKPFYKKPMFWLAVAGGVVVIGGGGYLIGRRRR